MKLIIAHCIDNFNKEYTDHYMAEDAQVEKTIEVLHKQSTEILRTEVHDIYTVDLPTEVIDWSEIYDYFSEHQGEVIDVCCNVIVEVETYDTLHRCSVSVDGICERFGDLMLSGKVDGYTETFYVSHIVDGEKELYSEAMEAIK